MLRAAGVTEERVSKIVTRACGVLESRQTPLRALALLVDEAQDCCAEQLALLRALQQQGAHITLVGTREPRLSPLY